MADSKNGQGHKDKYLDTSRKILSQEMLLCNSSNIYYLEVVTNVNLKQKGQTSRSKSLVPTKRFNHWGNIHEKYKNSSTHC